MEDVEERLTTIGYRSSRPAPECWRVARIGAPALFSSPRRSDPAKRGNLACWLDRLADRNGASTYRIRPSLDIIATGASRRRGGSAMRTHR